jgi:menaquinone-9 beta-reductase
MTSSPFGGGLGASALATSMATKGARVLILEKETQFTDRVRGEYLVPWGMAEAKQLGLEAPLISSCATALPFIDMGFGPRVNECYCMVRRRAARGNS